MGSAGRTESYVRMDKTSIEVRYSLARWDVFWAQLRLTLHNKVVVALCLSLFGIVLFEESSSGHPMYLPVAICGILIVMMIPLVTGAMVALMNTRGVTGEHIIRLSEEGFTESTEFNTSLHRWSGILRVDATKKYLLVFVGDFQAHVIPKRAFPSPAAAQYFEQRIREAINARASATK